MVNMDFSQTIKERICESNKKVSFSQKSSIETKSSNKAEKFDSMGQSFSVYANEVIESALFDRITRDCSGKILRSLAVRRFRKVGYDEWFSVLASVGNDAWINDFTDASNEDAIKQGESNNKTELDHYPPSSVATATSFAVVNPIGDEQRALNKKNYINNVIKVVGVAIIILVVYKQYNKN
jgi:hypothetical protein